MSEALFHEVTEVRSFPTSRFYHVEAGPPLGALRFLDPDLLHVGAMNTAPPLIEVDAMDVGGAESDIHEIDQTVELYLEVSTTFEATDDPPVLLLYLLVQIVELSSNVDET